MATAQHGIFDEDSIHHQYLEYAASEPDAGRLVAALARACADARVLGNPSDTHVVVAFGADLWRRIAPGDAPEGLRDFETIKGLDGTSAPATQRDMLFWIHGASVDDNLDAGLAIHRAVADVASLELDEKGFNYHDSRDLTGFVDGTANPKEDAARAAALVTGDAPGAGGTFVLTQR